MTNKDTILLKALEIYGEEKTAELLIQNNNEIPFYTKSKWYKKGFRIKENSKPLRLKIWTEAGGKFRTVYTELYTPEQVEKCQKKKSEQESKT